MYIREVREKMPNGREDLDAQINLLFIAAENYIEMLIPDLREKYNNEKELILDLEPTDNDSYRLCLWVCKDDNKHSIMDCPLFYVEKTLSKIIKRINEDRDRLRLLRSAFGELPF